MRVVVDARARDDLDAIAAWIAREHPAAAREVLEHLLNAMERLAKLPRLGRRGRVSGTYEWVVAPYIIVYEITQQPMTAIITGVFHASRDR